MLKALYPGSFDPITLGHLDIIKRASQLFDQVIVAIGNNINKKTQFGAKTRKKLIELSLREADLDDGLRETPGAEAKIQVQLYSGLTVDFAQKVGARVIVKGVRNAKDFHTELEQGLINRELSANIDPGITQSNPHSLGVETVLLLTDPRFAHLSSSLVRELMSFRAPLKQYLPPAVIAYLQNESDI